MKGVAPEYVNLVLDGKDYPMKLQGKVRNYEEERTLYYDCQWIDLGTAREPIRCIRRCTRHPNQSSTNAFRGRRRPGME